MPKNRETEGVLMRDSRALRQGDTVDPAKAGVTLIGPPNWKDGAPVTLVWVNVGEIGHWKGHNAGEFELTSKIFDEIVANHERRGLPLIWDQEHAAEDDASPITGVPSQGWIHRLENRGPAGLWALTEWLDYARDGIRSGRFAFCSPAIRFGCKDGVTGKPIGARLTSCAIVSAPFLTGLEGLVAASEKAAGPKMGDHVAAVRACLTAHAMCSAKECTALHASAHALCQRLDDAGDGGDVSMRDSGTVVAMREILGLKTAEIATLTDRLAAKDAELNAMRDADDERVLSERHLTYSRLKPIALSSMRALLKADRALFDAEFGEVPADRRFLLREITPPEPKPTLAAQERELTGAELVRQIQRERGISLADAQIEARSIERARRVRAAAAEEAG